MSMLFDKGSKEAENRRFMDKYGKYFIDEINHAIKIQDMINSLVEQYIKDRNNEVVTDEETKMQEIEN